MGWDSFPGHLIRLGAIYQCIPCFIPGIRESRIFSCGAGNDEFVLSFETELEHCHPRTGWMFAAHTGYEELSMGNMETKSSQRPYMKSDIHFVWVISFNYFSFCTVYR